jgi:hypothetical protein
LVLALRIDVDVPFGFYRKVRVVLNWLHNNYGIVPRLEKLGYLEYALKLSDYLTERGVPVTWFFRNLTTPSTKLMKHFKTKNSSINIHVEKTQSFDSFAQEVQEWEKRCETKATGFTKHGSGVLKLTRYHDAQYNPETLIEYGKKYGLRYFIGNSPDLEDPIVDKDEFIYLPSVYWIDRISLYRGIFDLNRLLLNAESKPTVVLMHPIWWDWKKGVRERLEQILSKSEFVPLEKMLVDSI